MCACNIHVHVHVLVNVYTCVYMYMYLHVLYTCAHVQNYRYLLVLVHVIALIPVLWTLSHCPVAPKSLAWVHVDSPLLERVEARSWAICSVISQRR